MFKLDHATTAALRTWFISSARDSVNATGGVEVFRLPSRQRLRAGVRTAQCGKLPSQSARQDNGERIRSLNLKKRAKQRTNQYRVQVSGGIALYPDADKSRSGTMSLSTVANCLLQIVPKIADSYHHVESVLRACTLDRSLSLLRETPAR